jgi:hypothetical protein
VKKLQRESRRTSNSADSVLDAASDNDSDGDDDIDLEGNYGEDGDVDGTTWRKDFPEFSRNPYMVSFSETVADHYNTYY